MLEFTPYFLLALAIISLWIKRSILVWGSLLILAFIMGLITERLTLIAIPSILILGFLFYFTFKENLPIWLRLLCGILASILSWALAEQKIPGFNNLKVISGVVLSSNAYTYSLFLNFDKALVGLIILGFGWRYINQKTLTVKNIMPVIPITILTIFTIMILAYSLHCIELAPKWTSLFWIWSFSNLFFVCVPEEAFFRGIIQNTLVRIFLTFFHETKTVNILAIAITAILFGLVHFYGGVKYIILSTVAGLFCGYSYYKTGRIEAGFITHFCLNAVHFIGFTYPALNQL